MAFHTKLFWTPLSVSTMIIMPEPVYILIIIHIHLILKMAMAGKNILIKLKVLLTHVAIAILLVRLSGLPRLSPLEQKTVYHGSVNRTRVKTAVSFK